MMTLRKLPRTRPSTAQPPTRSAGEEASSSITDIAVTTTSAPSDYGSQLEDRQVHRDHEAPHQYAEDHHDHRLEQARHGIDRVVHLGFVEGRYLARHLIE